MLRAFLSLVIVTVAVSIAKGGSKGKSYKSLFLSPYIRDGKIKEARRLSRVDLFQREIGATAHSGYITIGNTFFDNHLFFLHVKALRKPRDAPLLLWLQGGPGLSSLLGQFLEIGPLGMNDQGHLFMRNSSLNTRVNVIYLDQPVGAGFSYTKGLLGYANNLDDVAEGVLEFLNQFLKMFPEYKNREFYVGGESYGARFTVAVSHALHTRKEKRLPLRLNGAILGAGFLGNILEVADSADFLYETSMVTKQERDLLEEEFQDMRRKAKWHIGKLSALLDLVRTIFTAETKPTLFQKLTGYNNHASALYTEKPVNMIKYEEYVQTDAFKRAVHLGQDVGFQEAEDRVTRQLAKDYLTDISDKIEDLLESYHVLFYTGQMDTLFPSTNLQEYFRSLAWSGAKEFRKKQPKRWRAYNHSHSVSGFITTVGKMKEGVLLGAGHYAAVDRPEEANRLMMMFIEDARSAAEQGQGKKEKSGGEAKKKNASEK